MPAGRIRRVPKMAIYLDGSVQLVVGDDGGWCEHIGVGLDTAEEAPPGRFFEDPRPHLVVGGEALLGGPIGHKLDVIMVPKVQGAEDIHYVDRLLAQLEAKAGLEKPILVHAILETARGVANVEEICGASPRMQGLSLGPADLAADRRMKTPRVGGGHPGYLVRQDPVHEQPDAHRAIFQQDLWHYTIARMVDACATHGIYPYYGPFGDIADVVACEDQFRNAFLLGCVGTWSLHPKQIAIANKVFSPSVEDIKHARRVVAAMGDGTGAVMLDGKMEDDASLKQCLVMVELAEQLAAIDPELKKQYDAIEVD